MDRSVWGLVESIRLSEKINYMRVAFKMKLNKGCEEEYRKRHDALWPELRILLKNTGMKDYSIFLDEETNILFGYFTIDDADKLTKLPNEPVMKKWWHYIKEYRNERLFYLS